MTYWQPLVVKGVAFDLSHLEPFEFPVMPARHAGQATVSVSFNDHCFTEAFNSEHHDADLLVQHASSHERRAFDFVRYELSRNLPAIIRGLDGSRIASTREGNLVRVTLQDGTVYPVFFTLRKVNGRRANLFVVSAYPWTKPQKIATTGEMKFTLALAKVLQGDSLAFPNRR